MLKKLTVTVDAEIYDGLGSGKNLGCWNRGCAKLLSLKGTGPCGGRSSWRRARSGVTPKRSRSAAWRRVAGLASHEVVLTLDEAKELLAELQRRIVQTQIDEKVFAARICSDCLNVRPIRDRRTRVLQTLFGTVRVAVPRLKLYTCVNKGPFGDVSFSPLSELLPDRCTPELRRLQAELGARHSFREAARLLSTLLPCSPPNHASVRNRLHRVAGDLHTEEARAAAETAASDPGIVVAIEGAHIRAAPGYQTRHLDVTVGKVEAAGRLPRRFALAPSETERPLVPRRAALAAQGWRPGVQVTVISDGEAALPDLVRRATGSDVAHILDWWHISMRVRHAEQALQGVYALEPVHHAGLDMVSDRLGRIRHLLWNGYHDEAWGELIGLRHLADEAIFLNGEQFRAAVVRFLSRCDALCGYLANNGTALIDYGSRYRAGLPVSSSRAEGCVDEIANARMAKRCRMRWSPRGAPRRRRARRCARWSAHP